MAKKFKKIIKENLAFIFAISFLGLNLFAFNLWFDKFGDSEITVILWISGIALAMFLLGKTNIFKNWKI